MRSRIPWILIVVIIVLAGAVWLLREKPVRPNNADEPAVTATLPETTTPSVGVFSPAKVELRVPLPKPSVVEIQDGKTIDFSSGLPIIKDTEKDKAALERALKEMEAAAAEVTFGPATPAAPEKKN